MHEYRNLLIASARTQKPDITDEEIDALLETCIELGKQAIRAREIGMSLKDAYKAVFVFSGVHPETGFECTPELEALYASYAREVMIEQLSSTR